MPKKPLRFTVQVPVKPYVKHFVNLNYGSPVNFSYFPEENYFFQRLLKEPSNRRDCQTNDLLVRYTEILEILISEDDFYRFGWELTKTNILVFGKFFEQRAKFFMRNIVGVYHGLGLPIYQSIIKFQKTFHGLKKMPGNMIPSKKISTVTVTQEISTSITRFSIK